MFDLDGHGGTLAINGRSAGSLAAWRYGAVRGQGMRVVADVRLAPLYKRLGVPIGSTATVVLDPRPGALRPAHLTISGTVAACVNGKLTITDAKQSQADPVRQP